jgi:membrane dipeptidase
MSTYSPSNIAAVRVSRLTIGLSLLLTIACGSSTRSDAASRISRLLEDAPIIDGHVDLLIHYVAADGRSFADSSAYDIGTRTGGQIDIPSMRAGHVGGGIFTVAGLDPENREQGIAASTGLLRQLAERHPRDLAVVAGSQEFERALAAKRIAMLPGLEGGEQLGGSLAMLRTVHRHGVRSMTLVWQRSNEIGDSSSETARHGGLSPFGREVVREMNRLGMLVDLSHASDQAAFDVLAVTRAPVILSHSSARALCPAPRNASDELLRKVGKNGGVVMVTLVPYYTTPESWSWYERGEAHWASLKLRHGSEAAAAAEMEVWERANPAPEVTPADVADHLDHVRSIAGVNHVGIGSDFDGMGSMAIPALRDASALPRLFEELARRGWSEEDLRKAAGGNFLRVLRAAESAARELQGTGEPDPSKARD